MNTRSLVAIAAAAALALLPTPSARAAEGPLTLVGSQRLDARLLELTLRTPALKDDTHARILLPDGYDTSASQRYPVLYLLHGAIDDNRSWTDKGNAEQLTAGLPLIVVMPDAGWDGYYSDHFNFGRFGQPEWETYHIGQLVPWIDAHFRTIAARAGRATAGLSMGGFGAMSYPARHPDMFVAAAAFSGAVNTNLPEPGGQPDAPMDGSAPYAYWGPRATEEIRWRGHNPWDLAENLRGMALTIRTGNGYDSAGNFADPVEYQVHADSVSFDRRLTELGFPHVFEDYGAGTHAWPYWQRDLARTLPWLMEVFDHPPAPPERVTFTAIEPSYEAYGWRVELGRSALEWSRLVGAHRAGFMLRGSGAGTVTTPGRYVRRARYRVTATGPAPTRVTLRADRRGRLRIPVDLGPADTVQALTPQANATGATQMRTTAVRIVRVHR